MYPIALKCHFLKRCKSAISLSNYKLMLFTWCELAKGVHYTLRWFLKSAENDSIMYEKNISQIGEK